MQIAQVLGAIRSGARPAPPGDGKKKADLMRRSAAASSKAARRTASMVKLATELFDTMEQFAAYSFNKSHSAAYGLITYQPPG